MKISFVLMVDEGRLSVVAHDEDEGDFSPSVIVGLEYPVTSDSLFRAQLLARNHLVSVLHDMDAQCPHCGSELLFVNIFESRPGERSHDYACGSTRVFTGNCNEVSILSPQCQEEEAANYLAELADADQQTKELEEQNRNLHHQLKSVTSKLLIAMAKVDQMERFFGKQPPYQEPPQNDIQAKLKAMQGEEPTPFTVPKPRPVNPMFNPISHLGAPKERPQFSIIKGGKEENDQKDQFRPEEP